MKSKDNYSCPSCGKYNKTLYYSTYTIGNNFVFIKCKKCKYSNRLQMPDYIPEQQIKKYLKTRYNIRHKKKDMSVVSFSLFLFIFVVFITYLIICQP